MQHKIQMGQKFVNIHILAFLPITEFRRFILFVGVVVVFFFSFFLSFFFFILVAHLGTEL